MDDLIEDYMEDAFEEPPPEDAYYDEDMFEEAVAAEEQNNPRPAEAAADSAQKAVGTPASPIATDFRSRLAGTSVYSPVASVESPAAQVRQDFAQSRSRSGAAKADLFSFER